jgi:hypothetical protein
MSIRVMNRVWEKSPESGADLLMLLAIADSANDENLCAWPGIKYLAKKTRISIRSVYDVLDRLVKHGEIAIEKHIGRGKNNFYYVLSGLTEEEIDNLLKNINSANLALFRRPNSASPEIKTDNNSANLALFSGQESVNNANLAPITEIGELNSANPAVNSANFDVNSASSVLKSAQSFNRINQYLDIEREEGEKPFKFLRSQCEMAGYLGNVPDSNGLVRRPHPHRAKFEKFFEISVPVLRERTLWIIVPENYTESWFHSRMSAEFRNIMKGYGSSSLDVVLLKVGEPVGTLPGQPIFPPAVAPTEVRA